MPRLNHLPIPSASHPQNPRSHGHRSAAGRVFEALQEEAFKRIENLFRFAADWEQLQATLPRNTYEQHRAEAQFHLNWILAEGDPDQITFTDICEFSQHPDLSNVMEVRRRITSRLNDATWSEIRRPADPFLALEAERRWLEEGEGVVGCQLSVLS